MCKDHLEPPSSAKAVVWHPDDQAKPTPLNPNPSELYRPDVLETIEGRLHELDSELRGLSLDIHCTNPSTNNLRFLLLKV
jgi:hypothetical protein